MLRELRWWADLLDSRYRIPGTEIRFGIDPILSLIPGLGELSSPAFTVLLLVQGLRQRVPKVVLVRMVGNALLDALIGAIPIAGSVGDIFWRANTANLALLERYAQPGRRPTTADYVFLWAMAAILGLFVAVPVIVGLWLFGALLLWIRH
jgi:hypothetical protein